MSQIFDALLRSEAERDGSDPVTQAESTELLQRVERHAALKWATADLTSENDTLNRSEGGSSSGLPVIPPAVVQSRQGDEHLDPVSEFKSIYVSLPSNSRLVGLTDQQSPTAEAFRLLGVRLRDLRRIRPLKKVLITSTIPQEGKSTVSGNLACALAHESEERTLLIEGDVRRPSLTEIFELGRVPGICEWLKGDRTQPGNIYRLEGTGIWMLPAGQAPNTPLELLQSSALPILMDQLASWFDWIIIDSPPVLPMADTSIWSRMADGILLVTRQGVTEKQQLEKGLQALQPEKLIGAILNCSQASVYSNYYYRTSTVT